MNAAKILPTVSNSLEIENSAVIEKQQAFRTIEATLRRADAVKYTGIFVAGCVAIVAVMVYGGLPSERDGFPMVTASLTAGMLFIGLGAQLWSMILRRRAQKLKTATDAAVSSLVFSAECPLTERKIPKNAQAMGHKKAA